MMIVRRVFLLSLLGLVIPTSVMARHGGLLCNPMLENLNKINFSYEHGLVVDRENFNLRFENVVSRVAKPLIDSGFSVSTNKDNPLVDKTLYVTLHMSLAGKESFTPTLGEDFVVSWIEVSKFDMEKMSTKFSTFNAQYFDYEYTAGTLKNMSVNRLADSFLVGEPLERMVCGTLGQLIGKQCVNGRVSVLVDVDTKCSKDTEGLQILYPVEE